MHVFTCNNEIKNISPYNKRHQTINLHRIDDKKNVVKNSDFLFKNYRFLNFFFFMSTKKLFINIKQFLFNNE